MRKKWLLGGALLGGVAAIVMLRRKGSSGYDDDEIDFADSSDAFGERTTPPAGEEASPAETRKDVTAEELSMAARLETSFDAIRTAWPVLTLDEVRQAEGDLDRLSGLIAEKVEQPRDEVRKRLEGILAQETPDPSYPAH